MAEMIDFIVVIAAAGFVGFILSTLYLLSHSRAVISRKMAITLIIFSIIAAMMLYLKFTKSGLIVFGALTIMRIREPIKDHRDIAFIFLSVVTGFCCASHQFYLLGFGYLVITTVLYATGSLRLYDRIILVIRGESLVEEKILDIIQSEEQNNLSLIYNNSMDGKYTELIYEVKNKVEDKYKLGQKVKKMLYDNGLANEVNVINQRDDMKI